MKKLICFVFIILFLFSGSACGRGFVMYTPAKTVVSVTPDVCQDGVSTRSPMPSFLQQIYPAGAITNEEYKQSLANPINNGVQVVISAKGLDDSVVESTDSKYRVRKISEHVSLSVDDILIRNDPSGWGDGLMDSGPFYLNWPIELSPGAHNAKLIFDTDTEGQVSYAWTFCILP